MSHLCQFIHYFTTGSTAAGSPLTELCGISSSGESFLSTTNAMTVVFQSDYSFTLTGMLANYIEGEKETIRSISLHPDQQFFFQLCDTF